MQGTSKNLVMKVIKRTRKTYKDMFNATKISNWDKPFEKSKDPELGVRNPYSKISCFVVQLYSMELGTPPLYAEVNRVARDMDFSLLKELGPFLKTLMMITCAAELGK